MNNGAGKYHKHLRPGRKYQMDKYGRELAESQERCKAKVDWLFEHGMAKGFPGHGTTGTCTCQGLVEGRNSEDTQDPQEDRVATRE